MSVQVICILRYVTQDEMNSMVKHGDKLPQTYLKTIS